MEIALEWLRSVPGNTGNRFGIIFQCKSIFFEHISWFEIHIFKILEFWSDISTSTNKSRPGTLFKMCSRSWEYWRFQYHQKLLTQNRSCGLSKSNLLIFGQIWVGPNSEPVCYVSTPSQFWNFLNILNLGTPQPWSTHVLRLGMYDSGLQGVPNLNIFGKWLIWEALWRSVPRLIISQICINWFSKINLNSRIPRKQWLLFVSPASNLEAFRPT